ncbi:DNA polymerase epsilon noncatalytic subunit KNAG_0H03150 [Huiozyma naganishii CBS 8797]|uniref:DNA polymerase epsilon subunit D n=1 Tax=Huiozyma naganishii (strain ATCC MYA-139 / BCRC 22969 / CBS 8797 / KCTC 17520 / NBRC 10181 / NCYC 3082 / Yp74L-3) TaxID=1071383 RepID=J7RA28_HUIN7|nr:hypothetical protein KNAG_0H03150 [Kazachstania naganishii CBS 8797]CCK71730.1 hypothetical protein KNAG_0H03150 [Kazachstania naganishii CBS 8797]
MPPKGWRKDSQGNYPTTSYIKEQENVKVEDLLFPRSTVLQLAKQCEPEGGPRLVVARDAGLALQRSATVFVNHLLMFAREAAAEQDRRTCSVDDVLQALERAGHPQLRPLLQLRMQKWTESAAASAAPERPVTAGTVIAESIPEGITEAETPSTLASGNAGTLADTAAVPAEDSPCHSHYPSVSYINRLRLK